jgi:integrase
MDCARKHGRYGHRDATMILVAYRHGLRASEVCDLQWHQIELSEGRLHVRRVKNGMPRRASDPGRRNASAAQAAAGAPVRRISRALRASRFEFKQKAVRSGAY